MSSFRLIEENMELSHTDLAVPCYFNTIVSLFRDTESMFEVMAVSIENLLCSSVTGPQSRYNRECLILISNVGFQFGLPYFRE